MTAVADFLLELARTEACPVAELRPRRANAHIHLPPNFSAFASAAEAVELAAAEDLALLGATNYYDFTVYEAFTAAARAAGIFPSHGTEIIVLDAALQAAGTRINDPANPGKMYLCGKALMRMGQPGGRAQEIIGEIRRNDGSRMAEMAARLDRVFGAAGVGGPLDADSIAARVAERSGCPAGTVHLQERHLAQAFQERLFEQVAEGGRAQALGAIIGRQVDAEPTPSRTQDLLRSELMKAGKSCYVEETFIDYQAARRLVLELGGIVCYPVLGDGAGPACEFERTPAELIEQLRARGIYMAEIIPNRNSVQWLLEMVPALRAAGIVVSAGTEHNTPKKGPLEPLAKGDAPLPEIVARIFWEGACVLAAHQYLVARGECGLTDQDGRPHAGSRSCDERIGSLARLGEGVMVAMRGH